jgi:DNA-directed RNA polymerase subunit RPC12/RpoP
MQGSVKQHERKGEVRTDMHCHACSKGFLALLDYRIENNQIIECPHCGHLHYRKVVAGVVTEVRHGSDPNVEPVKCRKVWKHDVLKMKTTTASEAIRNRWLNFGEIED